MKITFYKIISIFLILFSFSRAYNYDENAHSLLRQTYEYGRQQVVERGEYKESLVKLILSCITYSVSLIGSIVVDSSSAVPREFFQIANIASAIAVAHSIYNWAVLKTKEEGKCDRYADNLGRYVPSKDEMDAGFYKESYKNNGDFDGYKYNNPYD